MRKATTSLVLGALLVAAPLVAQRGMRQGPPGDSAWGPRNPVAVMLEHRDALELTAEQVRELEGIQSKLEEQVTPLRAKLEELHGDAPMRQRDGSFLNMTEAERQAVLERREQARPIALEIMGLNRAAGLQAHEVLEPGQRALVMQFMRRGGMGQGMQGHPGMQGRGMRGSRGMGRGMRQGPPPPPAG